VDAKGLIAERFIKELILALKSVDASPTVGLDESKLNAGLEGCPSTICRT